MEKNITLAKLFRSPKEGEEHRPSIIAYVKRPLTREQVNLGNGEMKVLVKTWAYRLYVNLWIVEIEFRWTKHKTNELRPAKD